MTLARLLVVLLVCALPAFAQDQQLSASQNPDNASAFATNQDSATPAEPWRIMPNRASDLSANSIDRMRVDQYVLDQGKADFRSGGSKESKTRTLVMGLNGTLDTDATCFTMRSYVVARDSRDSDSTHPTGYSTCQPASKYRVRTTQQGPVVQDR
jgi:hypothetical protein